MPAPTQRPIPQYLPAWLERVETKAYKPYPDQGKVWTGGIGHTDGVGPDTVITDALIDEWLRQDLEVVVKRAYQRLDAAAIMRLSENQWGAICDFIFNCGAGPKWHIWSVINAGALAAVPAELAQFDKYKDEKTGKYLISKGLVNRRAKETAMWLTPDPIDTRNLAFPPPAAVAIADANPPHPSVPGSGFCRGAPKPQDVTGIAKMLGKGRV